MQLFNADAVMFSKKKWVIKHEKKSKKNAHNRPNFFLQYCKPTKNQSKFHFLLHENGSLYNFYIMTLVGAPRSPAFFNLRPTKNVMLQQMSRPNMLEHFLIGGSCLITNVFFILVFTRHQQNSNGHLT
jgi:hypothetical protein